MLVEFIFTAVEKVLVLCKKLSISIVIKFSMDGETDLLKPKVLPLLLPSTLSLLVLVMYHIWLQAEIMYNNPQKSV